ncbi:MAG: hypothetical protein HXY52_05255 [Nitrospirae bacterium]|jgi:tetratricopeptide (TPR) repeat protein|nr:hypothetical protein [Nitrospirota bacterium]
MKRNESCILILSIIIPLYLFILSIIISQLLGFMVLRKIDEKGLSSAISFDRDNATYYYLLGRFYQYDIYQINMEKAKKYYFESLKRNPLQGGCWLDLANIYKTQGQILQAGETLKRAVALNANNPQIIWEAGLFYLNNNNIKDALQNFKQFIILNPGAQQTVYDLLYKLPVNSDDIINVLLPYNYSYHKNYLLYLISTKRINDAKNVWKNLYKQNVEDELILKYTDFLISEHYYEEAKEIWDKFISAKFQKSENENASEIWNNSFELKMLRGGFDWKINEAKGVDIYIDNDIHIHGKRSLGIDFNGTENLGITLASQVVMVKPGAAYRLKANIKTNKITTTNGIYFNITGHDCKELNVNSEVVTGTNFWKELLIDFKVPNTCNALTIMIKRDRSQKLDNKISGSVWIDQIILTQK